MPFRNGDLFYAVPKMERAKGRYLPRQRWLLEQLAPSSLMVVWTLVPFDTSLSLSFLFFPFFLFFLTVRSTSTG